MAQRTFGLPNLPATRQLLSTGADRFARRASALDLSQLDQSGVGGHVLSAFSPGSRLMESQGLLQGGLLDLESRNAQFTEGQFQFDAEQDFRERRLKMLRSGQLGQILGNLGLGGANVLAGFLTRPQQQFS